MSVPRFTSGGDMGTPGWTSNCVIVYNKKRDARKVPSKKPHFLSQAVQLSRIAL